MARAENKETVSPTMRYVAAIARLLRKQKGWSQEELGKKIGFTGSAISAMETCAQPASDQMLVGLERELGEGSGIFERAREEVRVEKFPSRFKDFVAFEQKARSLTMYEVLLVNGLFQTEGYARALFAGGFPRMSDERVEELVDIRMARKAVFDHNPPAMIELVVDESALLRTIGSASIMREQLLHLAAMAQRWNVTLQVMPLNQGLAGQYAGTDGPFTLIETDQHDHLGYMEGQRESQVISDPAKVSALTQIYAKIRAQALGPRESLALIERLAGEEK
ncbi:helix-turn-helix domain-containing protein [Streptomyces liangshanensis]|uniref:helix-turn-helix domain-containing protein n=1 Tax=Streptomyces liangshanensis TaxID=2717324 RepID=UPI0036DEB4EB